MQYGRIIIFGGSSGIGLAASQYLEPKCKELITVSRRPAPYGRWIKTDLSQPSEIATLAKVLEGKPVDALLYLGGTWETHAFTPDYAFDTCTDEDLENVLNVNLLAPIRVTQAFLPHLRASENARIIVTGAAIAGLSLGGGKEVANTASMIGLQGMIIGLRQNLQADRIGVTLLKPGYVATPEVLADFKATGTSEDYAIPMQDLLAVIETVLNLSNRTNINEIEIPTML